MRQTLDRFHVGMPTTIGPLSLFPVWTEARTRVAVAVNPADTLRVSELDEPTVPFLSVGNPGSGLVCLTEGTVLHGGRQTRVLERDVLVPARRSLDVPVNCVEQGRWHGSSAHSVDGRVPISIISAMRASGSLRQDDALRGMRQDRVWQNVERVGSRFGHSSTSNLRDLREGDDSVARADHHVRIERERSLLVSRLMQYARHRLPGQSGVLIGALGHPLALEIITSPVQFGRNIGALLSALALDAAGLPEIPTPGRRARRFAEHAMDVSLEPQWFEGGSMTLGMSTELMTIQALQLEDGQALHTLLLSAQHDIVLAA